MLTIPVKPMQIVLEQMWRHMQYKIVLLRMTQCLYVP